MKPRTTKETAMTCVGYRYLTTRKRAQIELTGGKPPPAPAQLDPALGPLTMKSEEEFESHFGDAIDDRIAEILDELLEERNATRPHRRLPQVLGTAVLIVALITSVLLRHTPSAWTIWPATATICLVIAWTSSTR